MNKFWRILDLSLDTLIYDEFLINLNYLNETNPLTVLAFTSSMMSKLSFSFHLATDNSLEQLSDEVVYIRCRVMYGLILTWPDMKWRHATRALLACMLYVHCNESFCVFSRKYSVFCCCTDVHIHLDNALMWQYNVLLCPANTFLVSYWMKAINY